MLSTMGSSEYIYCNPVKVLGFLEGDNLSTKLTGLMGHLVNEFVVPKTKKFNKTLKFSSYHGFGERIGNSDSFTGCLGQIQSKTADSILGLFDYPMDVVNVSQGHIIYEERVGFVGSFPQAKFEPFEFSKTVEAFDEATWFTIIATLILFRIVIWTTYKCLDRKPTERDITFRMLSHFSKDGQIDSTGLTMKVIFMVLAVFSLVVIEIFCSLLRTGLVVSQPPKIMTNYDDLIKHNVKPSFIQGFYEHRYFKYADVETDENKLWKWGVDKFGEDDLMLLATPINLVNVSLQVANYKRVLFGFTDVLQTCRLTLCTIIERGEKSVKKLVELSHAFGVRENLDQYKFQTYIRYGKNMKSKIKQILLAENRELVAAARSYLAKLHEFGWIDRARDDLQKINLIDEALNTKKLGQKGQGRNIITSNCMLSQPVDEDRSVDEESSVSLVSLITCITVWCHCLLITNCVLICELVKMKMRQRKVQQSPVGSN